MAPKIYTKTGDQGTTSLVDGKRVKKSELRLEAYGTVDELNANIGNLIANLGTHSVSLSNELISIQNRLFEIGSRLACEDDKTLEKLPTLDSGAVSALELSIDNMTAKLAPLRNFILPGGVLAAASAHICRTVCRRCERLLVRLESESTVETSAIIYLNRLSDYFFVLARYLNHLNGVSETIWKAP